MQQQIVEEMKVKVSIDPVEEIKKNVWTLLKVNCLKLTVNR